MELLSLTGARIPQNWIQLRTPAVNELHNIYVSKEFQLKHFVSSCESYFEATAIWWLLFVDNNKLSDLFIQFSLFKIKCGTQHTHTVFQHKVSPDSLPEISVS